MVSCSGMRQALRDYLSINVFTNGVATAQHQMSFRIMFICFHLNFDCIHDTLFRRSVILKIIIPNSCNIVQETTYAIGRRKSCYSFGCQHLTDFTTQQVSTDRLRTGCLAWMCVGWLCGCHLNVCKAFDLFDRSLVVSFPLFAALAVALTKFFNMEWKTWRKPLNFMVIIICLYMFGPDDK